MCKEKNEKNDNVEIHNQEQVLILLVMPQRFRQKKTKSNTCLLPVHSRIMEASKAKLHNSIGRE